MNSLKLVFLHVGISMFAIYAVGANDPAEDTSSVEPEVKMKLTSPAFEDGDSIPKKFTCDGADVSPELRISNIPAGTKSLSLICSDPDAPGGDWVHWVLYNIPSDVSVIPENILKAVTAILITGKMEMVLKQGRTEFGKYGYGGPCPPHGHAHRYFVKLFALDFNLTFDREATIEGITDKVLLDKIKGHVIDEVVLMGKYQRK